MASEADATKADATMCSYGTTPTCFKCGGHIPRSNRTAKTRIKRGLPGFCKSCYHLHTIVCTKKVHDAPFLSIQIDESVFFTKMNLCPHSGILWCGIDSIELSNLNLAREWKNYRVSINASPFFRLGEVADVVVYGNHTLESGKFYVYEKDGGSPNELVFTFKKPLDKEVLPIWCLVSTPDLFDYVDDI